VAAGTLVQAISPSQPRLRHPSAQREQREPAVDTSDPLPPAAELGLERGQRGRLGDPAEHAEQQLVDEIDLRPACRWLAGDAERAQPRSGVLLAVQTPVVVPIPLPDRGELKVDPVGNRRCDQRGLPRPARCSSRRCSRFSVKPM
jgi:hypothetical protein